MDVPTALQLFEFFVVYRMNQFFMMRRHGLKGQNYVIGIFGNNNGRQ